MSRILVYKKMGDVYVKVRKAGERDFDWLKDEPGMKIVTVYIDEVEEDYFGGGEEGLRVPCRAVAVSHF